jgi:uncharacterized membrane protein YbhN (UPF0104 family)
MNRRLIIGVQIFVTAVLLRLLFRSFDWPAFVAVLRRLSVGMYLGSLLVVAVGQVLYALRWRAVLVAMRISIPLADVLRQYAIGIFFSNLMPTAIGGDATKVYYLGPAAGYLEVGASVVVDRALGLLWLAMFGSALAWTAGAPTPLFVLNRTLLTACAVTLVVLLALAGMAPLDRLWSPSGRIAHAWAERFRAFARCVRLGARRPVTLVASALVLIIYVGLLTLVYQRFFRTAGVEPPGALQVAGILASMGIFVNVPVSVNGIGVREQLHYLMFAALGVSKEVAVSISLLMFSHALLLSLVGYAAWLRVHRATASWSPSPVA